MKKIISTKLISGADIKYHVTSIRSSRRENTGRIKDFRIDSRILTFITVARFIESFDLN